MNKEDIVNTSNLPFKYSNGKNKDLSKMKSFDIFCSILSANKDKEYSITKLEQNKHS